MEAKGVLLVVLLMVCVVSRSAQEALQDVMQPSQGLHHQEALQDVMQTSHGLHHQETLQDVMQTSHGIHHPIADAIELLAAEGKQWLARVQEEQQLDQESAGKQQDTGNREQNQGRSEQLDMEGLEQQDNHRTGRTLTEATKEEAAAAAGRIFFGGVDADQQITISLQGLLSGVFFVVLAVLFFKLLAAIITGRDLSSWTNWANRIINPPHYPPAYYTDQSTYTAYRALEEVPEKYK